MSQKRFPALQQYALFLLNRHIDELTKLNIERAITLELPLLQYFKNYSETELFEFSKRELSKFLSHMAEGEAMDLLQQGLMEWRANKNLIPRGGVNQKDMVYTPNVRKFAFLSFIPKYTQDIHTSVALAMEIEDFYTEYNLYSLQAFVEIQQEILLFEKNLLQTVIDNTEEGITAYDTDKKVTIWNKALERRTGVKEKDIKGRYVFDLFPGYENSEQGRAIHKALAGEKLIFKAQVLERGGYYDATLLPLIDRDNHVLGVLSISRDITQEKEAIDRILKSEKSLKEAQELCKMGNWELDVSLGKFWWSPEVFNIFGREIIEDGIVSIDDYYSAIHPADINDVKKNMHQVLIGEKDQVEAERRIVLSDGKTKWIFIKAESDKTVQAK